MGVAARKKGEICRIVSCHCGPPACQREAPAQRSARGDLPRAHGSFLPPYTSCGVPAHQLARRDTVIAKTALLIFIAHVHLRSQVGRGSPHGFLRWRLLRTCSYRRSVRPCTRTAPTDQAANPHRTMLRRPPGAKDAKHQTAVPATQNNAANRCNDHLSPSEKRPLQSREPVPEMAGTPSNRAPSGAHSPYPFTLREPFLKIGGHTKNAAPARSAHRSRAPLGFPSFVCVRPVYGITVRSLRA
jgi:hypothetical protein